MRPEDLQDAVTTARRLRIHKVTLLRKARLGEIECVPVGRRKYFTDQQISDYLERQAAGAARSVRPTPVAPAPAPVAVQRNPKRTYKS